MDGYSEVTLDLLALGGGFHDEKGLTVSRSSRGSGSWNLWRTRSILDFEFGWHDVYCKIIYKIRDQFYTCFIIILI